MSDPISEGGQVPCFQPVGVGRGRGRGRCPKLGIIHSPLQTHPPPLLPTGFQVGPSSWESPSGRDQRAPALLALGSQLSLLGAHGLAASLPRRCPPKVPSPILAWWLLFHPVTYPQPSSVQKSSSCCWSSTLCSGEVHKVSHKGPDRKLVKH